MTYVQGFVVPVPAANKEAYRKLAADLAPLFKEFGATRLVEAWGDDVPDGNITDFKGAVKATPDEVVVFSWLEFPSKAVADTAHEKMMSDPRTKDMGAAIPFDGKRMIFGGFTPILDEGSNGRMGYADGALLAVPAANKAGYLALEVRNAAILREHGATRVVSAWGENVPDGKVTDYKGAVKATPDEQVVYAWIEWPSKEVRDAAWPKVMADPRMHAGRDSLPFDPRRMIHGGFAPILDV